jgi:NPCBM/NEW2 domain-containing protein
LPALLHGHGFDHSANPQQLSADFATMIGPQRAILKKHGRTAGTWLLFVGLILPANSIPPAHGQGLASFSVHCRDGSDLTGPLAKIGMDWSLRLSGDSPTLIAGADVVSVRRKDARLPALPARNVVILTNNDCIPLDPKWPVRMTEGMLRFRLPSLLRKTLASEVIIPKAFVRLLWLGHAEKEGAGETNVYRLTRNRGKNDLVLLRRGDRVNGNLLAIRNDQGCQIDTGDRNITVKLDQVIGIAFNAELEAQFQPAARWARIVLTNGARISVSSLQWSGEGNLRCKTLFGARLAVPVDGLVALDMRGDGIAYLSDLKPKEYQFTPFLGASWPLVTDASVSGRPLRLAGDTFDKGLGTHSQCRVTYVLNGKYRWFECLVGIHEHARGRAHVEVLVDGKEQNVGSRELSASAVPLPLRVDIRKARELTLDVRFGAYGDVGAHVDWAEARLLK